MPAPLDEMVWMAQMDRPANKDLKGHRVLKGRKDFKVKLAHKDHMVKVESMG